MSIYRCVNRRNRSGIDALQRSICKLQCGINAADSKFWSTYCMGVLPRYKNKYMKITSMRRKPCIEKTQVPSPFGDDSPKEQMPKRRKDAYVRCDCINWDALSSPAIKKDSSTTSLRDRVMAALRQREGLEGHIVVDNGRRH